MVSKFEEWRDIPGYEGRYQVSNFGRVKSLPSKHPRGRKSEVILAPGIVPRGKGYKMVNLVDAFGVKKSKVVHRLVLRSFKGEPPKDKPLACHRDGNSVNNYIDNLYWGSCADNQSDRDRHGTANKGERNGQAVLTESLVRDIKEYLKTDTRYGCQARASRKFGVNRGTLGDIARGVCWNWV